MTRMTPSRPAHAQGARRAELPPVELVLGEDMPRVALRNLYAAADAFVLPTRGEGWGLPIAEAMAMALPVIATNWSGPTALLSADNSFALPPATMLPGGQAEARRRPARPPARTAARTAARTPAWPPAQPPARRSKALPLTARRRAAPKPGPCAHGRLADGCRVPRPPLAAFGAGAAPRHAHRARAPRRGGGARRARERGHGALVHAERGGGARLDAAARRGRRGLRQTAEPRRVPGTARQCRGREHPINPTQPLRGASGKVRVGA